MKAILAFSGGLDTSYCLHQLLKNGYEVVTFTVDTGGFSKKRIAEIEKCAKEIGASKHILIDGKNQIWEKFCTYIIKGDILKGNRYPLCVGAERIVQAMECVKIARKEKATAIAHGSTGAGNDQVRFDVTIRALAPDLDIIAPIRSLGISREQEMEELKSAGISISFSHKKYSINESFWGVTIGGGEIHDTFSEPSKGTWQITINPEDAPDKPEYVTIGFKKGIPISLNGKKIGGVELVQALNKIGAKHGVGRQIHVGDTILGTKGRIAVEAPGPLILIEAHRELEKLVLTKTQQQWNSRAGEAWGDMLHSGLYLDPAARDLEALVDSSQKKVTGETKVKLFKGTAYCIGAKSLRSMVRKNIAVYGEGAKAWSGEEAAGFAKIFGNQIRLSRLAGGQI